MAGCSLLRPIAVRSQQTRLGRCCFIYEIKCTVHSAREVIRSPCRSGRRGSTRRRRARGANSCRAGRGEHHRCAGLELLSWCCTAPDAPRPQRAPKLQTTGRTSANARKATRTSIVKYRGLKVCSASRPERTQVQGLEVQGAWMPQEVRADEHLIPSLK